MDFLLQLRFVDVRTTDPHTTQTHKVASVPARAFVVALHAAPTLSFLNFIHCRSPILHSPLTLSPAATLELDFLRQLRFVDLGTPHPQTTHKVGVRVRVHSFWIAHALLAVVDFDAPTPSFSNFIHCRSPIRHSPLTLSPAATLELDFLRQLRFVDLGTLDPQTTHKHGVTPRAVETLQAPTPSFLNFIHFRLLNPSFV
jgi:hypothetical protein